MKKVIFIALVVFACLAFNTKLENNMAFMPGVVSRKKQIIPVIKECA